MRLGLALAAVLRAAHPGSEPDDRDLYVETAPAPAFSGPTLNWSNKQAQVSGNRAALGRPEPMALAAQFSQGRAQQAQQDLPPPPGDRRQTYQAPAYQPFTPQQPYQAPAAAPQAAPQQQQPSSPPIYAPPASSLYSGPPPLPEQARAAPAPVLAGGPPQRLAAITGTPPSVGGSSKLYSLHRAYGLEPDAIPEPPAGQRYVFIGPPDAPKAKPADEDAKDASDNGDDGKPF